ncbi:uncharacterized protein EI97DRAFT_465639 [Westerdykella ornata]|uniref:Uncharacterized protein n=1 Tax=Westerdykella ornata TaxID=318751 RepID=A0A6A6JNW4_WESOR|nr:uncharacterized protein EI97DRAFT_465639 [Westerdykella ornata]KAF2278311.1 hypothetical protein EI97DRAFT_465639 [Westerdykella ornata]
MAAANGTLTPPAQDPSSSPSSAKRKRSDAEAIGPVANGASTAHGNVLDKNNLVPYQALDDIVSVLESYDTQPSILKQPIVSSTQRTTSGESELKRTKLTPVTIADLVKASSYTSLELFQRDVESAISAVLSRFDADETSSMPLTPEIAKARASVLAFRKIAKALVAREEARRDGVVGKVQPADSGSDGAGINGQVKAEPSLDDEMPESQVALTLYGTAQGPKQLFSSLQQPVSILPAGKGPSAGLDTSVKVTLPLNESALPNIISTTEVFPLPEDDQKSKSKTFGEVFPPPPHIPQLSPPKLAKPQTGRGNTITFAPQDSTPPTRTSSRTFSNQPLATGHWLGYGGVDMPKDATSPTAKQKSRQRALSTGEAQLPPSEATLAAVQKAKEDALFRSAFSSFAPSKDDSMAVVPEETKNMVWWHKVGEKRFRETFPIDPLLLRGDEAIDVGADGLPDEETLFKDAVEDFIPAEQDPFEGLAKSEMEKTTDDLLQEISELIETLASYQRIRNSSLATNSRTQGVQNSALASLAGNPSTPSSQEFDIYHMLKSQLTIMISQLPPYAVAKLNGDQLDELNISRTLIIETEDHKGVLEEDQLTRRPVAASTPSLTRVASTGSSAHYPVSSTQYARPTATPSTVVARPSQSAHSYYPQQQAAHRSPSVHYPRSTTGAPQSYQSQAVSYSANTPKPAYGVGQYGQQTPKPTYGQATTGQYYTQRPAAPAPSYSTGPAQRYYQSTPQPQSSRYAPQQLQNGYYQRPQNGTYMQGGTGAYAPNPTPSARTSSPMKPIPSVGQANFPASRASYSTPVASGAARSTYYPPGGAAASQYATPQPSTPSAAPAGGYNGMVGNHSQMMLDRQQAQYATQSQARLAAQNTFHGPGSGTPQPPTPQHGSQPPANGAPMIAQ